MAELKPKAPVAKSGSTLDEHEKVVHVAEIVQHGEKVIIPEGMSLDDTIDLLERRKEFLEEEVILRKTFNVFPWDGGNALDEVLTRKYGWAPAKATPGFFGKNPPQLITIEIAPGQTKQIPWGRFQLPQISGFVQCGVNQKEGRMVFELIASILRKDEKTIQDLFIELEQELKVNSIYSGKAFKMRFRDEDGDVLEMPEPSFINTDDVDENMLVFPEAIRKAVETNLFTPIKRVADCKANGIPIKRGVLLGGTYGTGKTMAAKVASKFAVQNGVTYLYVPRADELADAVNFAKLYQDPACVIFCEDIDRVMDGERTESMDDILNIIDGIDTKSSNILVVLTTNDLNGINPAMLRPGRLDAVIDVLPPDAEAVEKLIRIYGGAAIASTTDLTGICAKMAGRIPAVIAEVVKRAKLAQLSMQSVGTKVTSLTSEALEEAAETMQSQLDLLYKEKKVSVPTVDSVLRKIVEDVVQDKGMPSKVSEIHQQICE
jgi:transitional endoplasmic reticulum ATPase